MTKERKKNKKKVGKEKICVKEKNGRKRERKMDRNEQEEIKKCSKTRTKTTRPIRPTMRPHDDEMIV